MVYERLSELEGLHAFMSPSQFHWINYTKDKLAERYLAFQASERGTKLHEFAKEAILLNQRLAGAHNTLTMFVNDAIGYKMEPELPLFYSWNCFGTADALVYKKNFLRIHDLKTGKIEAHFEQLRIYAALFCLHYQNLVRKMRREGSDDGDIARKLDVSQRELHFDPEQMSGIELRIYQLGEVRIEQANPAEIRRLMDIIVSFDEVIRNMKAGE